MDKAGVPGGGCCNSFVPALKRWGASGCWSDPVADFSAGAESGWCPESETMNPLLSCLLGVLLLLMGQQDAVAADANNGKMFYLQYCSACHGQEGRGNGPVSRYMTVKIPDLSPLKKNNHGVYPVDQVLSAIDGRRDVRAHGNRHMPVWGEVFTVEERKYPERSGSLRAKLIADYVATLQR